MSRIVYPFLKWAGGKSWAFEDLTRILEGKQFGDYYDPFVGAGSAFSIIKATGAISGKYWLSDLNPDLINAHRTVRDEPVKLISSIKRLQQTKDEYYRIRTLKARTSLSQAARFIYLNKMCFNGLYRENKLGEFNVPFGNRTFSKTDISIKINKWSSQLEDANLSCSDFAKSIESAKDGDLVYLDPPYTVAHNNNGFVKYNQRIFRWEDQIRLAATIETLIKRGVKVILSNASHYSVVELFGKNLDIRDVSRASAIGSPESRRRVNEILATNI